MLLRRLDEVGQLLHEVSHLLHEVGHLLYEVGQLLYEVGQQIFADSHQGVWLALYPGHYEQPEYKARGVAGWAQE